MENKKLRIENENNREEWDMQSWQNEMENE